MKNQVYTCKLELKFKLVFIILLLFSCIMSEILALNTKHISAIRIPEVGATPNSDLPCDYFGSEKRNFAIDCLGDSAVNDTLQSAYRFVIPLELSTPNYRTIQLEGIGYNPELERQDPSYVIKVDNTYYVFTSTFKGGTPYTGDITYATSADGIHWKDRGVAITKGLADTWDNYGVLTPYIMAYQGKYYLYYTSSRKFPGEPWTIRGSNNGRHIGLAIADSPNGPWQKLTEPVLSPGKREEWDSYLVDDAHVIVREGQLWLYYKGGDKNVTGTTTQWGLAIANRPTGPFVKHKLNPLIGGHTVCVWPHRDGVAALIDDAGSERYTVQWSPDGLHFQRAASIGYANTGCGPYDPDAHSDASYGRGITWGVAQERKGGRMYIVRFEVDCLAPSPDSAYMPKVEITSAPEQHRNHFA